MKYSRFKGRIPAPVIGLWAVLFSTGFGSVQAALYHVDSRAGDDTRSGMTPEQAWKSLDRVNAQVFQPGDMVLLRAGTRYSGQLSPQGSGQLKEGEPQPIRIGSYGDGPKPRLDGEGQVLDTLLLRNLQFWEVENLEITNLGTNRVPWRTGVRVVSDGLGKMRHLHLRNLHVHDVNGDLRKSREGCGIFFESRGGNGSHFDDLLIENCHVVRTDRNGICQRTSGGSRSLGVVIRHNLLEDIGGDGIKVWGSNGALIEHNVLRGGRTRCEDYAAGIWPFDSDDTVIQCNEVSGMKGVKDGQGFDSDYRCRRSLFQYNYSHDNEGGFILICTPGTSYNEDTVVRYNISQNDGLNSARVFHFGGGPRNTQVYNNTIYIGPNQDLPLLLFTEWSGGNAQNTQFYNNIFYVEGRVTYQWGQSSGHAFEHNVFHGRHEPLPPDAYALREKPPLTNPGRAGPGRDSCAAYRLAPGSEPMLGRIIPAHGGRDFFGNAVPEGRSPWIGAHQPSGVGPR